MFDFDEIEKTDPSPTVRLNFQVDEKLLPVRAPSMRLPGRIGQVATAEEHSDTLPMFVDRRGWTPKEITQLWETEWKVRYASRIKFLVSASEDEAQDGELRPRYLQRFDEVPEHPAVVRLEGSASIILSLLGQLRVHGSHRPTVGQPPQLQQEEQRVQVHWVDNGHRQQLQLQHRQQQEGQQQLLPPQQQQREERKQERLQRLQALQQQIQKHQQQEAQRRVQRNQQILHEQEYQGEQRAPAAVPTKRLGTMHRWAEGRQLSSISQPQNERYAVSAEMQPAAAASRATTSEETMRAAERQLAAKLCLDFD